jgi:hypothetical protein
MVFFYSPESMASHGGDYEEYCLMKCNAMQSGRNVPVLPRTVLLPSAWYCSTLKMEAACCSET